MVEIYDENPTYSRIGRYLNQAVDTVQKSKPLSWLFESTWPGHDIYDDDGDCCCILCLYIEGWWLTAETIDRAFITALEGMDRWTSSGPSIRNSS